MQLLHWLEEIWVEKIRKSGRGKLYIYASCILVSALMIWLKYEAIPGIAKHSFESAGEWYGINVEVDDWTVDLSDLRITANDVTWDVRGKYSFNKLFEADEISFDFSFWKWLLKGRSFPSAVHEIQVKDALIHVEHKNSGRWNWESAFDTRKLLRFVQQKRQAANQDINSDAKEDDDPPQSEPDFSLDAIYFDDLRIVWVEELPGNSSGGLIQRIRSEMHISNAEAVFRDIVGLIQNKNRSVDVEFDGYTADGVIQIDGRINPFSWGTPGQEPLEKDPHLIQTSCSSYGVTSTAWEPTLDLSIYLENVGASAIGRMAPDTLFTPINGSVNGTIKVSLNAKQIIGYATNLHYEGVRWEVNKASSAYSENKGLKIALEKYQKNGEIVTSSKGRLCDDHFKLVPSIQSSLTRQALSDAPPIVRKAVAKDQIRYEDNDVSPILSDLAQIADTANQVKSAVDTVNRLKRGSSLPSLGLPKKPGALPIEIPYRRAF